MLAFAGLAISVLLVSGGVVVSGSDVNWGKKVPCFMMDDMVICPGCNQRAGISCPRKLKESRNCLVPSTEAPYKYPTNPTETTVYEEMNATKTTHLSFSTKSPESNKILPHTKNKPFDIAFYLHRLRGSKIPTNRYAREAEKLAQEEVDNDEESCYWNGDCPCPLICCKTGPGCPKKCVMGIRLPPPFG